MHLATSSLEDPSRPRALAPRLWLALALSCSLAYADTSGNAGRQAKELVDSIASVAANRKLAAEPLDKAKDALERSQNARDSQDTAHADLLEQLALEWAETARDLTRAVELEQKASDVQEKAAKVEAKTVRALAIVEAAVARRGRAGEKLEALEQGSTPSDTSEASGNPAGTSPKAAEKEQTK